MRAKLLLMVFLALPLFSIGQSVNIGDILCTDGSIVSRGAFPSSGKTAQGVVFYVNASDSGGWAVALDNQSNDIKWSSNDNYGYDLPDLDNFANARVAMHDLNGRENTGIIRSHGNSNDFPAAWAVDYDLGWYLPSGGQLRYLYSYAPEINASLRVVGGTLLPYHENNYWWSSTEHSGFHAFDMNTGGSLGDYVKDNHSNYPPSGIGVRQIKDFSIPNPVHPTYHIGDLITNDDGSQGILFYLTPDQSEGWMVALNDASTSVPWGDGDVPGLDNQTCSAPYGSLLDETDGYANTGILREHQSGSNTAANVVDYEHGWYLPTAGQLSKLFGALAFVENQLLVYGSTLAHAEYWSSSEANDDEAFVLSCATTANVRSGHFIRRDKTSNFRVREVRNLSQECIVETNILGTGCNSFTFHGVTYDENGHYEQLVESPIVCDTLYNIEVNLGQAVTHEFWSRKCEEFTWNGTTYTETGQYQQTFETTGGCDSIVTLHLTVMSYPETVGAIEGPTEVYVSTDLILGQYFYSIDSVGFADRYEWELEGVDWPMDTTGLHCSLWVTSPGDAILRVKAWNGCGFTEREILIHSGFFDLDEMGFPVALYPNPAHDRVVIEAEGIRRIKVFNLQGQCVIEKGNAPCDQTSLPLQNLSAGLYLIEIQTNLGIGRTKLSIEKL